MQITPELKKIHLKWTLEAVKYQQLSILLTQIMIMGPTMDYRF